MKIAFRLFFALSMLVLAVAPAFAQTQPPAPDESLTAEVAALRKSVQTLNNRLQTLTDGLLNPTKKNEDTASESIRKVVTNLDLLAHEEQRAEVLRKQLIELIEKETAYKVRMGQFDEDLRPENIERSMVGIGG